ncbi:hypothetical protein HAX54_002158, partial [Datura stramonium]|nr:hypothetical protein [Datura stramonium]
RLYRCEGVADFRCIYGPVDGLFFLEKGHYLENVRFCWWNPATKECRLIPKEKDPPPIPGDVGGTLMLQCGSLAAMSCSDTVQPMTSIYDIW